MDIALFQQKFIEEATLLLQQLDSLLLMLEQNPNQNEIINKIYRIIHTLKGSSGMFGFGKISEITHELEDLLCQMEEEKTAITGEMTDLLFATSNHINNLLEDPYFIQTQNIENHFRIAQNIDFYIQNNNSYQTNISTKVNEPNNKCATWHILFNPVENLANQHINLSEIFHDLFLLGQYHIHPPAAHNKSGHWNIFLITTKKQVDIEQSLFLLMNYCKIKKIADFDIFNEEALLEREKDLIQSEKFPIKQRKQIADKPSLNLTNLIQSHKNLMLNTKPLLHIKVETYKIDKLIFLVDELLLAKSQLLSSLQSKDSAGTSAAAKRIEELSNSFNDNAKSIRQVSIQELIMRFKRPVRDLSKSLDKSVEFITQGDDMMIDKNIIDSLYEPLLHLIRNCLDHGIEPPLERLRKGKSQIGHLHLITTFKNDAISIEIKDDGRGISTSQLLEKAIKKGIVSPQNNLSDQELIELVFKPGLSTCNEVNSISGRGIGMSIVKSKLDEINATIDIQTSLGNGTSFTINIPISFNYIKTLLIQTNNIKYAIPVEDVEASSLSNNNLQFRDDAVVFNQERIPVISNFNLSLKNSHPAQNLHIVVIKNKKQRYAILADEIIGEFKAFPKPVDYSLLNHLFVKGICELPDGTSIQIIDTEYLTNPIVGAN
jgi:two-component system chemotaxis sensor kinase CheA